MDYRISIPKPCHEDWEAMTPNDSGRFCFQCEKTVTDFTGMSALEIQSYLLANSGQKVCGRFKSGQLDKVVISVPERVLFTQTKFRNIFLLALLVTMGTTLFSCNNGQAIEKVTVERDSIENGRDSVKLVPADTRISCDTITIEGHISSPQLTGFAVVKPLPPPEDVMLNGEVIMDPTDSLLPPPPEVQETVIPGTN